MFGAIFNLCDKIRNLKENEIAHEVFEDKMLQTEMLRMNTEEQLYEQGVDAEGKTLGQYAKSTIDYWKPLAASEGRDGRTDHVTLKDSGDFYMSFKFQNNADDFVFTAETEKGNKDLTEIYGKKILGLTNESINSIKPQVTVDYIGVLRQKISA